MTEEQIEAPSETQTTATETQEESAIPDSECKKALPPAVISADGNTISRMVERDITVELTDQKLADLACEAADLDKEKSDLEAEKKKLDADLNERIKKKDAQISTILASIREGQTTEFLMVKEVRDYATATVTQYIGKNYDEKVDERAMEGDELQKDLFLRSSESSSSGDAVSGPTDNEQAASGDGSPLEEPPSNPEADLKQVMREETSKFSKHSSVDGPMA